MLEPVPTGLATVPVDEGMLGVLLLAVGTFMLLAGLDMELSPVGLLGLTLVLGTASGLVTGGVVVESPPDGVPIPDGGVVAPGVVVSGVVGLVILPFVIGFFFAPFFIFFLVGVGVAWDKVET
jgi:hypothetical protein